MDGVMKQYDGYRQTMEFIERRKNLRVTDALSLKIDTPGHSENTTNSATYVVKLSTSGMRFLFESELPENKDVNVSIQLASQPDPINILAQVVTCTKNAPGSSKYSTRMIFKQIDSATHSALEKHISDVIDQTSVIRELPFRKIA